jgi:phenylalanyl-tRNA synthetase beta chain
LIFASLKQDPLLVVKGMLESLVGEVASENIKFVATDDIPGWSQSGGYAIVESGEDNIGYVGLISSQVATSLGLKKEAAYAELSMEDVLSLVRKSAGKRYSGLQKFPSVVRDLAFVIDEQIEYNDLIEILSGISPLLVKISLFDIYHGQEIGEGKKSLAFHMEYSSPNRTLTSSEVDEAESRVKEVMSVKFDAVIRNI